MQPQSRRVVTVDGFISRTLPQRRELHVPPRPVAVRQPVTPTAKPMPTPARPRPAWKSRVQWAAIITGGLLAGLVMQAIPLGYLAVAVYGAAALVKRIPSRFTFMLALGALIVAPIGIVIGSGPVADGFALIGFLLLSVGVVTLGIELKRQKGGLHT